MKILLIITICIMGLIFWRIWNKINWKTVMVGADIQSVDQLRQKHDYYRLNGVRCKIVTEVKTSVTGDSTMIGDLTTSTTGLTKLLVHRNDIEKVKKLI